MAQWHLDELRDALDRKGWHVVEEHLGDGYKISATWMLRRYGEESPLLLDFDGLDEEVALPVTASYACHLRSEARSLYFRRHGEPRSPARARWKNELGAFVDSL